jgi:hypothetical protein
MTLYTLKNEMNKLTVLVKKHGDGFAVTLRDNGEIYIIYRTEGEALSKAVAIISYS